MLKSSYPTVSVCIPTYLGGKHLGSAIDSVLEQTFSDFELLIIDDNSPDDTSAVVAQYKDPRIRFLRNTHNLGPEGNWNRCLAESKGKYFKLLPQDDFLYPTCLEHQVIVLDEDKQEKLALVFCARKIIDSHGCIVAVRKYPGGKTGFVQSSKLARRCVRYGTNLIGEPGSVLFRRTLAQEVGDFDGSIPYTIDLDYWFRLLLRGEAYYLADPLVAFRVSSGSWSVAIGSKQSVDFQNFITKVLKKSYYNFNYFDIAIGHSMAKINNYLRLVFYRFILAKEKEYE